MLNCASGRSLRKGGNELHSAAWIERVRATERWGAVVDLLLSFSLPKVTP